jgi:hypothetical protein
MRQTSRAIALLLTLESARATITLVATKPTPVTNIVYPDWASQFNTQII